MKTVIGISLGAGDRDFSFPLTLGGTRLRVRRIGCDGDLDRARALRAHWATRADAIGLGFPGREGDDFAAADDGSRDGATPRAVTTRGERLRGLLLEWALRHAQQSLGHWFDNARVLFLSGVAHRRLALAMSEYTPNLRFADPVGDLGAPLLLDGPDALATYARAAAWVGGALGDRWPAALRPARWLEPLARPALRDALREAHVVVAAAHELDALADEPLSRKTLLSTTPVDDLRLARFRDRDVTLVIDAAPVVHGHAVSPELLDAMLLAATGRAPGALLEDEALDLIGSLSLAPRLLFPNGVRRTNRFAFVIHPLSQEYFRKVGLIDRVSRVAPAAVMDTLERALAFSPPLVYSKVEGIRSPTGVEAEGWLITVGGTPREIMRHPPEFTYERLLAAADMARRLGAQVMGLGAFTKVVGDAGITVARRAPLPITTGNSYSASAALWAAHDAMLRLKLLPRPRGRARVRFRAMVVGATGSIGAACARLLARAAEEVVLVSPEAARLLALKESILRETPDARLVLAAKPDAHLPGTDMVVTATSGAGAKVLDIMKAKPGCVITDVARPLDLPPEEVARRPDVLVIESGEIQLPGDVRMKDIGLPPGVAYACLAETIVLALEGRFESFTVGRAIEWEKVREIYRLGLKHGMRLAAISGSKGVITDEDIARVRSLALEARRTAAAH